MAADKLLATDMPPKISGDQFFATEVERIRAVLNQHADALDAVEFPGIAGTAEHPPFTSAREALAWLFEQPGFSELVLPQQVRAGNLYLTSSGIWAARYSFNAQQQPVAGPNWRLVLGTGSTGGGAITSADITDATAAGRAMLTAPDAPAQRALVNNPNIAKDAYGTHPRWVSTDDPTTGLYQWLIRNVLVLLGALANPTPAQRPAAPTDGQVNDQGDTFSFLPTPVNPSFAQYKVAGLPSSTGAEWLNTANSYVQAGRVYVRVVGAVAKGGLAVFVGASGNMPDGQPLTNADPFTENQVPITPGALAVDFAVDNASLSPGDTLNFTAKASGGTAPYQHSVQALNVDTGAVTVLGTANTANYTGAWQQVPDGVYLVTDAVTDAAGGSLVSATRRVVVAAPGSGGGALVPATRTRLGGVRVGDGLDVEPDGELSAQVQLQKVNIWQQVGDYSAKGLKLPVGGFIDEAGHLFIRQVDVGQRHFTFGRYYSLAKDSIIQWKPDEYIGQDGDGDVGLARVGPGELEVNTGTAGQRATLRVLDVVADSAPASLNSIQKLAANKAGLDPNTKRLFENQALEAEYPLYLDNGKYKYDDQALYLEPQYVGKRVNPLTGKLENDANYTTFVSVKVQPGVTYESVGLGIAYAAYIDVTNAWRQAWTIDANGASSANASYNSRAFSPPNNGSITEIYLWLSVRTDDAPTVRIRPTQLYNDAELRRLIAAVSNQTLFNYVPLAASTVDNYITASYFGSLYELSFGSGIDPSATNLNVWLPVVTSTNVKQSVVVRLLASQTGKTVSVYGRPAATAAGDRVLLQVLKPGDSAGFTVMSAYSSPYIGYGITFSTVLPTASGGGGGGVTPQQLEAVRTTVVIGATISGDTTLSLSAAGALLPVSTNSTITVPANADVPFGVGVVLELVPTTGAMPLVAAAAGVTILAATGNRGAGQGSPLRLTQLAADSWLLTGGA